MKATKNKTIHPVVENLLKIARDNNIKQETIAKYAEITPSQMSKILSGNVQLSLWQLSNTATCLEMRIIDIVTYPEIYELRKTASNLIHIMVDMEITEEEFCKYGLKNRIKNKLAI